jgi:hypothetical protein
MQVTSRASRNTTRVTSPKLELYWTAYRCVYYYRSSALGNTGRDPVPRETGTIRWSCHWNPDDTVTADRAAPAGEANSDVRHPRARTGPAQVGIASTATAMKIPGNFLPVQSTTVNMDI